MKYLELIKIQIKSSFTYKMSTIAGIIVGIFQVYIMYYIWCTVYDGRSSIQGYELEQMVTYIILSTLMYRMIELGITLKVSDMVRTGDIALRIVKPMDFVKSLLCESIGTIIANFFITVIPVLFMAVLTLKGYWQMDLMSIIVFVFSFILALLISMYIDIIFGLLTFWTENGWGLRVMRQAMIKLFSGALLPVAIMPAWLQGICSILPFKTLIDIPLNIYIFGISKDIIVILGYQLVWVVILMIAVRMLYRHIVKRLDINGG